MDKNYLVKGNDVLRRKISHSGRICPMFKRAHILLEQRKNLSHSKWNEFGTILNSLSNKLIDTVQLLGFTSARGRYFYMSQN